MPGKGIQPQVISHQCVKPVKAPAHERAVTPLQQRITLAAHRPPRGAGIKRSDPHPEEKAIVEAAPETALYVAALKQKGRKAVVLALRQLLRLLREYPREPFLSAVGEAARYGLYDLDRLERMILRRVARDYFLLLDTDTDSHEPMVAGESQYRLSRSF